MSAIIPFTLPVAARLNRYRLIVTMLWPDDEQWRAVAMDAAAKNVFIDTVQSNSELQNFSLGPDRPSPMEWLRTGPSIEQIQAEAKPRYYDGMITGEIIRMALLHVDQNSTPPRLHEIKSAVLKKFKGRGGRLFDVKNLDNIVWPKMRPVGHFWVAYIRQTKRSGQDGFPCSTNDLPQLLSEARQVLERAAKISAFRSNAPLLDPAIAWTAPPPRPRRDRAVAAIARMRAAILRSD